MLTVPRYALPDEGYPIAVMGHGTNGNLYRRVDWNTIWLITMGISLVLLVALVTLFRDDVTKKNS